MQGQRTGAKGMGRIKGKVGSLGQKPGARAKGMGKGQGQGARARTGAVDRG